MIYEVLKSMALAIDLVGVAVMLVGFVLAVLRFLPTLTHDPRDAIGEVQVIRCSLGTYLVFALELMIVADLIHSIASRTLEDLYFLAAIVVLRTLIAYFLNKEIEELRSQTPRPVAEGESPQ